MREQHMPIRHRHHIIVKGASSNRLGALLGENRAITPQPMQPRHRRAGLNMLARGEGAACLSVYEHLDARLIVAGA